MTAIKFDEEKVTHCIQAYEDEHNKKPCLIMCKKTTKILPPLKNTMYISASSLSFGEIKSADETNMSWNGCKILIDNDLDFGEVRMV